MSSLNPSFCSSPTGHYDPFPFFFSLEYTRELVQVVDLAEDRHKVSRIGGVKDGVVWV